MTKLNAGTQIDSQKLYEQQQKVQSLSAPAIIADCLRTPGNIASVFRIADAMNARELVFLQQTIQTDQDKLIQRHSRNTMHIKTSYLDYNAFYSQQKYYAPLIALELTNKATPVTSTRLPANCSLVIGSERFGISDDLLERCHSAVYVPMHGINGSMNVSHALAICLYEWHRQQSASIE